MYESLPRCQVLSLWAVLPFFFLRRHTSPVLGPFPSRFVLLLAGSLPFCIVRYRLILFSGAALDCAVGSMYPPSTAGMS